ncbi:MAG: hypothetical protein JRG94_21715 [Deltaproteobacteria bacterium]|nr:hypothetical protein [Deltaproteobacteria bacterium]
MSRDEAVTELWRRRPRNQFVRMSLWAGLALMIASWMLGDFDWADLYSARRQANLARFLVEVRPFPLQGVAWDWGVAWSWASELFAARGAEAARTTLGISLLAILLAGASSVVFSLPAARNFSSSEPFLPLARPASLWIRAGWRTMCNATRMFLMSGDSRVSRGVPAARDLRADSVDCHRRPDDPQHRHPGATRC